MRELLSKFPREDLRLLADIKMTEYGRVLLKLIEEALQVEQKMFDLSAKISLDPLHEDFRWKLGDMARLRELLDASALAKEILFNTGG